MSETQVIAIVGGGTAVMLVVMVVVIKRCWHSVAQGHALIINRIQGEPRVAFSGALVVPIVQKAETIDLAVKQIVIDRRGKEGVICHDNIRADLKVTFQVRVNNNVEDIIKVARSIGCARAADQATLEDLFTAKFSEAIKTVANHLDFEQLFSHREEFKDRIIEGIGKDLNGYILDDAAVDYLEQTPIEALDPNNILDAKGIQKILSAAADLDEVKLGRARRSADVANPSPRCAKPLLQDQLERLGLLDLRIITEVSCDVGLGRPSLTLAIDAAEDAIAKLPASVPRAIVAAIGSGELTCSGGRATFRWTQTHVSPDQLVAGARLVHALREDDHVYR